MKVIEWNINHRYGHSKKKMPKWIKDVIDEEKATQRHIRNLRRKVNGNIVSRR